MPQVHLDTIPIWDAYKLDAECPVCALEHRCEQQFLDVALGGAMMEPDTRIATNEKGFCPRHFAQLYDAQNRLSLALMTHTHLKDVMASTEKLSEALLRAVRPEAVFISAGADNRFGHPAAQTLARIRQSGAAVYRTDLSGTITIRG